MIDRSKFARDFFFELMKDSQRLRAGYLSERERWLRALAVEGREEVLFEFEMLLRGIERFFNLHNLPIEAGTAVVARNFMDELKAVRDAINRALKLARFLLDPPSDRRLMFRKYLESKIADDRVRRELIEAELEQGTPQESLFLIRSGFSSLRGVLDSLQRLDHASYQLFNDIGQLALREIALNKYFKPFRPLEFRPEYDRLKNVRILETLAALPEPFRKPVSIAFLGLYRLLHYLRYVPAPGEKQHRRSQVILALVRSEIAALAAYLEGDLSARLAPMGTEKSARALHVAEELRQEAMRIVKRDLAREGSPDPESLGRARNGFEEMGQRAVISLAEVFAPGADLSALFDDPVMRKVQAHRLRTDLFAFREVCREAEQWLVSGEPDRAERAIAALKAYVAYFRDVSYQLLRYSDFDPYDRFTAIINETPARPAGPAQLLRLADDCRTFTEVLDRTFTAVSRREALAEDPFSPREGTALASRFLQSAQTRAEAS